MKIAILGAGNGGMAAAGDLALKGHEIRLYEVEEFAGAFEPIRKTKQIVVHENGESKTAEITKATHKPEQAIRGADLVLVIIPAFAQKAMAEKCCRFFSDDQHVFLVPGGFGSYVFRKELRTHGIHPTLGETATLPYGARRCGANEVVIHLRAVYNPFAALPAAKTLKAADLLKQLYPDVEPAANVLDAALNNTNPCVHPVPTILSASRIEHAGELFWIYREAMTPAVWRVMRKVDEERIAVRKNFGLKSPHCRLPEEVGRVFVDQFGYDGILAGRNMKGPEHLEHRYITEDVPTGLVFYSEMGRLAGIETPTTDAVIELASQLLGRDFRAEGRNLDFLDLTEYTPERLIDELS